MSIVLCKYRLATDNEVNKFIEYKKANDDSIPFPIESREHDMELISFMEWHNIGQGNFSCSTDYSNTYKKLADKYNLLFNAPIYEDNGKVSYISKYFRLIYVDNSWHQGWFMKSGWKRHKSTCVLFDNLNSFNKYCMKYMDLKCGYAADLIHYFNDTFKNGEFIEISW